MFWIRAWYGVERGKVGGGKLDYKEMGVKAQDHTHAQARLARFEFSDLSKINGSKAPVNELGIRAALGKGLLAKSW